LLFSDEEEHEARGRDTGAASEWTGGYIEDTLHPAPWMK
jgi:hypothetical protein